MAVIKETGTPTKTAAEIAEEAQKAKDNPVNKNDKNAEIAKAEAKINESYDKNKARIEGEADFRSQPGYGSATEGVEDAYKPSPEDVGAWEEALIWAADKYPGESFNSPSDLFAKIGHITDVDLGPVGTLVRNKLRGMSAKNIEINQGRNEIESLTEQIEYSEDLKAKAGSFWTDEEEGKLLDLIQKRDGLVAAVTPHSEDAFGSVGEIPAINKENNVAEKIADDVRYIDNGRTKQILKDGKWEDAGEDEESPAEAELKIPDFEKGKKSTELRVKIDKDLKEQRKALDAGTEGINSYNVLNKLSNNAGASIAVVLAMLGSAITSGLAGEANVPMIDVLEKIISDDITNQKINRELSLKRVDALGKLISKDKLEEDRLNYIDGVSQYRIWSASYNSLLTEYRVTKNAGKKEKMAKALAVMKVKLDESFQLFGEKYSTLVQKQEAAKTPTKKEIGALAKRTTYSGAETFILQESMGEKERSDFRGSIKSYKKSLSNIDNIEHIINTRLEGNPLAALGRDLRAEIKQDLTFLQASLRKVIVGEGAVTENERMLIKEVLANPTDTFSLLSSTKIGYKRLKEILRDNFLIDQESSLDPKYHNIGAIRKRNLKPAKGGKLQNKPKSKFE